MSESFPNLFSPLRIGSVTVRNRIVVPPHGVVFPPGQGSAVDRTIDYHVERAKGGAGLLVMSNYVVPEPWRQAMNWSGIMPPGDLGGMNVCNDPAVVPAYARLAASVHDEGALIFSQLNAGGRQDGGPGSIAARVPLWAPSALPCPKTLAIPKEMETDDIAAFVAAYVEGARTMREAGFDGVELFAAQGYLLSEFLSPHVNQRTDRYGGSLENRMRFMVETLEAVRSEHGAGFVLGVRMNGEDGAPGGLTIDDSQETARRLADAGLVDYLNISGLSYLDWPGWIADLNAPPAMFAGAAQRIKEAVPDLPVCVVGRIGDPALAENLLAKGQADLIGMARALISDPELPDKARRGDLNDIRRCTYGNQSCIMGLMQGRGMGCVQNPAVGHEAVLGSGTLKPAVPPRRIIVVGGGPAGMAAARVAAERGHQVTLYERDEELGGQNRMTARIASRKGYAETTRWLAHRLGRAGVNVQLGHAVTAADIRDAGTDAVVVATGSTPRRTGYSSHRPHIAALPGVEQAHVFTVWDVFYNEAAIGEHVVLIDEDPHFAGIFTAEHLADLGRRVDVVTPGVHAGRTLEIGFVPHLYRSIMPKGVSVAPDTFVTSIEADAVMCESRYTAEVSRINDVDTVVLAMGNEVQNSLYRELKGRVPELHTVGDCVAPRNLADAIFDGERVGRLI